MDSEIKMPIEQFRLQIESVDVHSGDDDSWSPEMNEKMAAAGFSMKGGLWVSMSLVSEVAEGTSIVSCVALARRAVPREREPNNGFESGNPKFAEYFCFQTDLGGTLGWGAAVVNSIIAANQGRLPEEWVSRGLSNLEAAGSLH
jgi:hypothetical protein